MKQLTRQQLERLDHADLKKYAKALKVALSKQPLWKPWPGSPQEQAYSSKADILLYGGAAGGGKTDLLLGLAFTAHKRSIIFRREYPQFEAIRERGKEIIGDRGKFIKSPHEYFEIQGRKIELGAIQHEKDKEKYQGRQHSLICFDELTHFTESMFNYVRTWLRSSDPNERCRVVCASNPPSSPEGRWVISGWAPWLQKNHPNPAKPGELRWFISLPTGGLKEVPGPEPVTIDGREWLPHSRTFIPAKVTDNPVYAGTQYEATLHSLEGPLRRIMLDGDFLAGSLDSEWQVIPTDLVEQAQNLWEATERPEHLTSVGFDAVRGGSDKGAIAPWYDFYCDHITTKPGTSLLSGDDIANFVIGTIGTDSGTNITVNVDVGGVGVLSVDALRRYGFHVNEVNNASSVALRTEKGNLPFVNLRAALWWKFGEALRKGDIALPPDTELKADLTSAMFKLTPRGIQIEEKKDIKKRIGRSPDKGEACMYGYYHYLFNYSSMFADFKV